MIRWLCLSILCVGAVRAAGGDLQTIRAVSRSGQFVVLGETTFGSPSTYRLDNRAAPQQLEPATVAIVCEKIRAQILAILQLPDRYWGKIQVVLVPRLPSDHRATLISTHYVDGWRYNLQISAKANEFKIVRAITQCLLMEIANRNAGTHSAEIPTWLSEGMALEVHRLLGPGFSVRADVGVAGTALGNDGLAGLRAYIASHKLPPFSEIAVATPDEKESDKLRPFQAASECLVHELIMLRDGSARMLGFLQTIPQFWNWQTAFFQVYEPVFPNMLTMEKWWSLAVMNFPKGASRTIQTGGDVLDQLDVVLALSGQIQVSSNTIPARAELSLQQVIKEAKAAQQREALTLKIRQLAMLELNTRGDLTKLIGGYRLALQNYLSTRFESQPIGRTAPGSREAVATRDVLRHLDRLDKERDALRTARGLTRNR